MANNWTYLVYDPDTNQFKIGRSVNPFDRLRAFKAERPRAELIQVIPDHSQEFALHDLFDEYRKEGEWFAATESILIEVEERNRSAVIVERGFAPVPAEGPAPEEQFPGEARAHFLAGLGALALCGFCASVWFISIITGHGGSAASIKMLIATMATGSVGLGTTLLSWPEPAGAE